MISVLSTVYVDKVDPKDPKDKIHALREGQRFLIELKIPSPLHQKKPNTSYNIRRPSYSFHFQNYSIQLT